MTESILVSVKKTLGIDESYLAFDIDIIMHTNSAFAELNQIGIGPEQGFDIQDASAVWSDFLGTDKRLNSVKTYVYLSVRMIFDPPSTSFLLDAFQKQLEKIAWRLNVLREETAWVSQEPIIANDTLCDGVM